MARPYGEGIVFNILMKVLYIAYLAMYMAYAVLNYIAETGNDFVNFIVITFISVSIVIFVIANVLDWVYKNADARSKIKVRLHTLRNMFKIIKVGVSILVLAQTISDDSWNALTITMLVISLPTSLIWLLGEYVYVAIAGIFRRKGRKNSAEDADEEYDDAAARVTPVHDTIERVKQFAESELIVLRPHEVDYDSDEQEDVNDGYLGYEEDDDFSYPPVTPAVTAQDEKREYQGAFCVEEIPLEGEPLQQADTGAEREDWSIEEVIEEVPEEESAPAAEESASKQEESAPAAEESEDTQIKQEESVQAAEEGALSEQEENAPEEGQASQDTMQEESAPAAEENAPEEGQASQDTMQEESAPAAEENAPEEGQASQDITQEESAPAAEEGTVEQERESASEQEESAPEHERANQDAMQEESAPAAEEGAAAQEESVTAAEESVPEEERESTEQEAGESAQDGSGDNE